MKKIISIAMIFALCLSILIGCTLAEPEIEEPATFCRVEWVYEDGFIANADGRMIFVISPQAVHFKEYDTVVIEFNESDLREETGTRPYFDNYEITYTHVLENPKNIRLAGPGEPTFA